MSPVQLEPRTAEYNIRRRRLIYNTCNIILIQKFVEGIEDCADWTGYNDDEANIADIDIACTRVLATI